MSIYLGLETNINDSGEYISVTGQGSVFGGLGPYTLTYPFTDFSDVINPDGTTEMAFIGDNLDGGAINKDSGVHRTTYWAFPIEVLDTEANRVEVLDTFLTWCDGSPSAPIIEVDPKSLTSTLPVDGSEVQLLTINNYGTASLNWIIEEDDKARDSPSDIPWLSVSPINGVTAPTDSSPTNVTFDATGLAPGGYNANFCVSSDDPVTPLVQVPVAMTVTGGGPHFASCVSDTGNNATVAVPADITVLGGIPLEVGDEIAVFNPDGSHCVGLLTWQGSSDAIAVWGDDTQTVPIDGIETGEAMHYYF